jgi:hypothetical protein
MDSEALVAVGGTEGSQLHWSLGGNNLGRAVGGNVDTLGLLLLDLLLDPEVGEPQPILHMVYELVKKICTLQSSTDFVAALKNFFLEYADGN